MTENKSLSVAITVEIIRNCKDSFCCCCCCFNETLVQWNLVIKRSDIAKRSYNKVILLVPALYISLFFYPDITRNLI